MPRLRYGSYIEEKELNDSFLLLGDRVVEPSEAEDYYSMLDEAPWEVSRTERNEVIDAIMADLDDHPKSIEAIAVDDSRRVYPEDFISGRIYKDGSGYSLTLSTLDFSSFVPFEGSLFYNAMAQGRNEYNRKKGILLKSMFPPAMISQLFSTLKKARTYPGISIFMYFDENGNPLLNKFNAARTRINLRKHYTTPHASNILGTAKEKNITELSRDEATLIALDAVASEHTRYNSRTDRRVLGQLGEVKKLAMGHLGQAIGTSRIPALWQTTFHHRMFGAMPIEIDGAIHNGFTAITPGITEAARIIQRNTRSRIPFATTQQPFGYDPSDIGISFRADCPLRESIGLLGGYAVSRFLGVESAPSASDLARVVHCEGAKINRGFMEQLAELER